MASSLQWLACWVFVVGLLTVDLSGAGDALVQAVRDGDRAQTATLIEQGVDINAASPDGATVLHWAAHLDDLEILRLLLQAGANVNVANVYGVTPQPSRHVDAALDRSAADEKAKRADVRVRVSRRELRRQLPADGRSLAGQVRDRGAGGIRSRQIGLHGGGTMGSQHG